MNARLNLFPSAQARYEFVHDLIGRFAVSSTIARPGFNQVTAATTIAIVLGWAIRNQLQLLKSTTSRPASRPPLSLDSLPSEGVPTEAAPLIEEINRLMRRLSTAMDREKRFVTDAAHCLRTPLTALQIQAEILDVAMGRMNGRRAWLSAEPGSAGSFDCPSNCCRMRAVSRRWGRLR